MRKARKKWTQTSLYIHTWKPRISHLFNPKSVTHRRTMDILIQEHWNWTRYNPICTEIDQFTNRICLIFKWQYWCRISDLVVDLGQQKHYVRHMPPCTSSAMPCVGHVHNTSPGFGLVDQIKCQALDLLCSHNCWMQQKAGRAWSAQCTWHLTTIPASVQIVHVI